MKPIDDLRAQLNRLFADADLAPDIRQRFKAQLEGWLNSLNIVSREEFDAQAKALQAAQQQLQRLEQQIEELKSSGQ